VNSVPGCYDAFVLQIVEAAREERWGRKREKEAPLLDLGVQWDHLEAELVDLHHLDGLDQYPLQFPHPSGWLCQSPCPLSSCYSSFSSLFPFSAFPLTESSVSDLHPLAESHSFEAESHSLEAESYGSEAESPGSEAESQSLEAESHSLEAESHSLEAESHGSETESPGSEAESPGSEAESHGSEAESYESEAESPGSEAESHVR
jgi:hypothetical protein